MDEIINIEAEIKGYVNRGISAVSLSEEGELLFTLTDGVVKTLGKVREAPSEVFDELSSLAPSMKAVAQYVGEKLSEALTIDSEVVL